MEGFERKLSFEEWVERGCTAKPRLYNHESWKFHASSSAVSSSLPTPN